MADIDTDAVTSAVVHPMGIVMATSSGQRHFEHSSTDDADDTDDSNSEEGTQNSDKVENSLKIWSLLTDRTLD